MPADIRNFLRREAKHLEWTKRAQTEAAQASAAAAQKLEEQKASRIERDQEELRQAMMDMDVAGENDEPRSPNGKW